MSKRQRTGMDAEMFDLETFVCPPEDAVDALPLFADHADVVTPDVRTPAPAAPGSATSLAASLDVSSPFRRQSWRKIMLTLGATSEPLSMHAISVATDLPINVVCARIPELEPLWIARQKGACQSHAKASLKVDGFTLTPAGRSRIVGWA